MARLMTLFIFMLGAGFTSAQERVSNKFSIIAGGTFGLIHADDESFQNSSLGGLAGVLSENPLKEASHLYFTTGLLYQYRAIAAYKNNPYYFAVQNRISLTTTFRQHGLEVPLILKYRSAHSRISAGAGVFLSYLVSQSISQSVHNVSQYDSLTLQRLMFKYSITDDNQIHSTNRFNCVPVINVGFMISKKIDIEFFLGYSWIAPLQVYLNYNRFSTLTNSLCLTIKLDQL